jgi:hypothetical protein
LISNRDAMFHSTELENLSCLQQVPTECRLRVMCCGPKAARSTPMAASL